MRLVAALVAAVALVAAPPASAKEIVKVKVCGLDGCVTTRDHAIRMGLMNGGPPVVPPPMRGGVISLRSAISDGQRVQAHFTSWWAPSLRLLVAEDGTWMRLRGRSAAALARTADGLEPFPPETIGLRSEPFDWLAVVRLVRDFLGART